MGLFITLEGGEGAGKSTQCQLLAHRLGNSFVTREPGGTACAEWLRHFILSGRAKEWGSEAEAVLFAAARLDHVERKIKPALKRGENVICDRFYDSTLVYQGYTGKTPLVTLSNLQKSSVGMTHPDFTIMIDIPVEIGLARATQRTNAKDRFEAEKIDFHHKIRSGFLKIASENKQRCVVIDGSLPQDLVAELIWQALLARHNV